MSKIGSAKYGNGYSKKTFAKLKDGTQIFRIVPPIRDLADDGIWSRFLSVHYGYKTTKGELRTFLSPLVKNHKKKMIEVPDAALERLEQLKAAYAKAKAEGNAALLEKLAPLVGPNKAQYNLDNNHHMNALDAQENPVVLKLRHNAKKALDARIETLRSEGVDPLSVDNGRWFVFTRKGMGLETTFTVDVLTKEIDVPNIGKVKQEVVHVLDEEMIKKILKDGADLDKLYRKVTAEEVAAIVKTSDLMTGKSSAIDEIFSRNDDVQGADDVQEEENANTGDSGAAQTLAAQLATPTQSAPAPAQTSQSPVQAPVAVQQAAPAAQVQTQVAPAPTVMVQAPTPAPAAPQTTAKSIADMSNDEFLATVGLK